MTPDAVVARIQRDLGFRDDLEAEIIKELEQARIRNEDDPALGNPWFLKREVTLVTVAGTQTVAIDPEYIRLDEDSYIWLYDSTADPGEEYTTQLVVDSIGVLRGNYAGEGAPEAVAILDQELLVFPVPDDVYTLKFYAFFRDDPIVAGGTETQWLKYASDMMMGEAGARIASPLRDKWAWDSFNKMRDEGRVQLMRKIIDHELEGQRPVMGGDD